MTNSLLVLIKIFFFFFTMDNASIWHRAFPESFPFYNFRSLGGKVESKESLQPMEKKQNLNAQFASPNLDFS